MTETFFHEVYAENRALIKENERLRALCSELHDAISAHRKKGGFVDGGDEELWHRQDAILARMPRF